MPMGPDHVSKSGESWMCCLNDILAIQSGGVLKHSWLKFKIPAFTTGQNFDFVRLNVKSNLVVLSKLNAESVVFVHLWNWKGGKRSHLSLKFENWYLLTEYIFLAVLEICDCCIDLCYAVSESTADCWCFTLSQNSRGSRKSRWPIICHYKVFCDIQSICFE